MVAVFLGILLQGILIGADSAETPWKVAVKFTKSYFQVDPSMAELLCKRMTDAEEGNPVEKYTQLVNKEAENRGFHLNYMKHILYNIETHTHLIDDTTAEVKITGKRRACINPVFALVAKFFLIGKTYDVNERITVIKEDERWKVCGNPFSLAEI